MVNNRNRLYSLLLIACIAGYIWTFLNMHETHNAHLPMQVCMFKYVTDIPCPSCGATRSIIAALTGHYLTALTINPIGFIIALIMLCAPLWVIVDLLRGSSSLFNFYRKMELRLQKPQYSIPMVALVLINWVWNINKGL